MPCSHHDSRGNRCHLDAGHGGACETRRLANPGADYERPHWVAVRWTPEPVNPLCFRRASRAKHGTATPCTCAYCATRSA